MNDFNNYKDKLDSELCNSNFLYSGDVISSQIDKNNLICFDSNLSDQLLKKTLCDIYDWSFERLFQKSEKIQFKNSVDFNFISLLDNIYHQLLLNQTNYNFPSTIFFSPNSFRFINQNINTLVNFTNGQNEMTPNFFQKKFTITFRGNEISFFMSPLIKDSQNDFVFYLTDKPIQSMMWIIQNMNYQIIKESNQFLHQIDYPLYECDYCSWQIRITDIEEIRAEKINKILN